MLGRPIHRDHISSDNKDYNMLPAEVHAESDPGLGTPHCMTLQRVSSPNCSQVHDLTEPPWLFQLAWS